MSEIEIGERTLNAIREMFGAMPGIQCTAKPDPCQCENHEFRCENCPDLRARSEKAEGLRRELEEVRAARKSQWLQDYRAEEKELLDAVRRQGAEEAIRDDRKRLNKWLMHRPNCRCNETADVDHPDCTCGLRAALAPTEKEEQ